MIGRAGDALAGRATGAARVPGFAAARDGAADGADGDAIMPECSVPPAICSSLASACRAGNSSRWEEVWRARWPASAPALNSGIFKPVPALEFIRYAGPTAETRLEALPAGQLITPNEQFYVRNHADTPILDASTWALEIRGDGVERPVRLSYAELTALPAVELVRCITCAGNGRAFFGELLGQEAEGDPWRLGAYGVARWVGPPLSMVLQRAGLRPEAAWVMPVGLDEGGFARPLPLAKAMLTDTILATRMNGDPLPPDHGFPARVVASGWIGAASVKWVGALEVTVQEPKVKANTESYVLLGPDHPQPPVPLTTQVVQSSVALAWPGNLPPGRQKVRGFAWSPHAKIARVEISLDGGRTFLKEHEARLVGDNIEAAGVRWEFEFEAVPGDMSITPRATDAAGNGQPELAAQKWNKKGYMFAAPVPHPVRVG